MPAKNSTKTYVENGYYHIYNRGIEKREIFLDEQDCKVFLYYLKLYLSPPEELVAMSQEILRVRRFIPLNLYKQVDLLSFALMPNHIHLLIKQHTKDGIIKFMQRLSTSYVMYFNKKYERVGSLFQNTYKAALVESDSYLLHLSRYIHLNSFGLKSSLDLVNFSSYPNYLGEKQASWVKPQEILSYFKNQGHQKESISYKSFVEDSKSDFKEVVGDLIFEED